MTKLAAKLQTLRSREEGATAVEYGVLIALIIAILIVVISFIGQDLLAAFKLVDTNLGGNNAP